MQRFYLTRSIDQKMLQKMQLIMKLSFVLFFIGTCVYANTYSQDARVKMHLKEATLTDVFREIEKQSDYRFFYNNAVVGADKRFNLDANGESISDLLNELFRGTNINYRMVENYIVIIQKGDDANGLLSGIIAKQGITITGKIADNNGDPIPGANVVIQGSTQGVVTDTDGRYSITVPNRDAVLSFSFVGYVSEKIIVGQQTNIDIVLQEETKLIDEIVVIGYGTRRRSSVTGAVDQVNSSVIENRPVANSVQALQGASANLIIQQRNMDPTDGALNINIRGLTTINNNDPLIVIDGMITEVGTLNNLNPSDIEYVSVLKDAGSAAIYGSRSANGVILVTTKKGAKNSKPTIRVNAMLGIQQPNVLYTPVKGYENAMLKNQTLTNVGNQPVFTQEQIDDLRAHGDGEWFLDGILQNALQQNYNASVSGGSQNSSYSVSAGYYNQESNLVGNFGSERYNFRTNLTTEYGRFKLTTVLAYNRRMQTYQTGDNNAIYADGGRIPAYYYYKMQADDGRYLTNDVLSSSNPLGLLKEGGSRKRDNDNILANLNGEFELMEGLKLKGLIGFDLSSDHRYTRVKEVAFYPGEAATVPVYANKNRNTEDLNEKRYILNTQVMLDFDRTFKDVHHVTGLIGFSNESYTRQANQIIMNYTDRDLGLPETETVITSGSYNTPSQHQRRSIYSLFGRAGYSFQDKYYGEFSFRYDGSSKFASENRWGFFPSISAGWRPSEEVFMEGYKNRVGSLKIRGSYGVLGNQNVDDYSYFTTYSVSSNIYGYNNAAVAGTGFAFGNRELQWETTATFNIGVDATFFRNQFYVSFDFFNKLTSDILLTPVVPSTFGGSVARENAGELRTRGWEVTLGYQGKTGDFHHNISLNVADSKNELVKFTGNERITSSGKINRVGEPIGSYFGLKTNGLFQSYEEIATYPIPSGVDRALLAPGDVKFVNFNDKDNVIDNADRQIYGNGFPRLTFGFNYTLTWKGFDLGVFMQGVGKRDFILRGEMMEPYQGNYGATMYKHQMDFWTPENTGASRPRLAAMGSQSNSNNWQRTSDLFLLNGAYLRLKNLQVGYTLPTDISSKAGIQKLRISLNAQNLFTISHNSFFDPEATEFGNNMDPGAGSNYARQYPLIKYYGIGLDLTF